MTSEKLAEMMKLSQSRAAEYLHLAKEMVMNEFGPATEHTHQEVTVEIASAMMRHEGAQMIADAIRKDESS